MSLDTGLIFDREARFFGENLTQTLEPRLFYVNIPYRNQDPMPLFDTALADFNFPQLFTENRFNGGDRFGDANQLTSAVTSRFLSAGGQEAFRATIGQINYFRDERVGLTSGFDAAYLPHLGPARPRWAGGRFAPGPSTPPCSTTGGTAPRSATPSPPVFPGNRQGAQRELSLQPGSGQSGQAGRYFRAVAVAARLVRCGALQLLAAGQAPGGRESAASNTTRAAGFFRAVFQRIRRRRR